MRDGQVSSLQAKSLAISAQGLDLKSSPPSARPDIRHLRRAFKQFGVLQIDAVNAVARSHLLVLRARLGGSHSGLSKLLDNATYERRELVEYWCHEASFLPTQDRALFKWRMQRAEDGELWKGIRRFVAENPEFVQQIEDYVCSNGPVSAGELQKNRKRDPWWGWSDSKIALEWLFWIGRVSVSHRHNFTRYYDLSERVLSSEVLKESLSEVEAQTELIRRAAGHLGVGTAEDLVDYFRLPKLEGKERIRELVENNELLEVEVEGWDRSGYIQMGTKFKTANSKSVLLSPFDPLIWFRPRVERMFQFKYRLEIYVPAKKRVHGYYVLPFLHNNDLCARVDVRADNKNGVLHVPAAHAEIPNMEPGVVESLATELESLAFWRNLKQVKVGQRGNLARQLKRVIGT
ncbi:MAG: cytoplasmic protein [Actinobacteria bacterium]|nr:cytoplasmic protein [Actinomycetota bacterium]